MNTPQPSQLAAGVTEAEVEAACRAARFLRTPMALTDVRRALESFLASRAAQGAQPVALPADTVSREDFDRRTEDLARAKALLVKIWDKAPAVRELIERATGSWFVWGADRDAAPLDTSATAAASTDAAAVELPVLLTEVERQKLLCFAEDVWADLQRNELGGYSGINRPFYLLWKFKTVIEGYGRRDVGLTHSKNALDEAYERGRAALKGNAS